MYTDLAAVRAYLTVTSTIDDSLIAGFIASAQVAIENHCRRTFEAATDSTRYLDVTDALSDPEGLLYLDTDLCQITSVTNGDGLAIVLVDLITYPRNSTPWYALKIRAAVAQHWTYTSDREDAVTIVGRWAYSVSAPGDIAHACVRLAAFLYRQRDSNSTMDRPTVSPDGLVLMPASLPKDIVEILNPYRKRTPVL